MHPREGWQPDGTRRVPDLSRRQALKRGLAATLLAGGGASLLDACAPYLVGPTNQALPRPNNPVRWPTAGTRRSPTGCKPETGATLQVYNWVAYINQAVVNAFAKKYNCKVQITTFNTMDEALAKLSSGLKFDVFMGVTVGRARPAGRRQAHPAAEPQLYPRTSRTPGRTSPTRSTTRAGSTSVPYTIYTTGIAWRKDLVDLNPYTMRNPWKEKCSSSPSTRARSRSWTTTGSRSSLGADDERHLQPQHHEQGCRSTWPGRRCRTSTVAVNLNHPQQRLHRGHRRPDLDPSRVVRVTWPPRRRPTCPRVFNG